MEGDAVQLEQVNAIRDDFQILHDISVSFPYHQTTIIMGPSGCGKSTILKIAAGIVPPEEGTVYINGKNYMRIPERELISLRKGHGFVFQDGALWANKTVAQNLSLPLQLHFPTLTSEETATRVTETLEAAGYHDAENLRPDQLSAGERKIVSFARAVVTNPELIFIDDPTVSVDHEGVDKIIRIIRELKEEKRTLIISTHDPMLTSMVADNLVIIKAGRVLEAGPFQKVTGSKNKEVISILSDVLSQTSTYAGDILDLLDDN